MQSLHPRLIGFLEGLCAASVTHYPAYGMYLRGPHYGPDVPAPAFADENVTEERLQAFFVRALSDTSAARPQDAAYVVARFHAIVRECHPLATIHCEIPETRGWFDGLGVWLREPTGVAHVFLDWSVS